ncbi:MAG: type II toxin-antitoxin system MqsA family antitoxin [SAR202 cluster bacterium]|nr:type II toxin-antitoxin system MqsA family antitoxin [SAR202 cluster bacterium]
MKCIICKHGELNPGNTSILLTRDSLTLVVKNVPALLCSTCGEEYVDGAIAGRLLETAEEAVKLGVQVDVRNYVAA